MYIYMHYMEKEFPVINLKIGKLVFVGQLYKVHDT